MRAIHKLSTALGSFLLVAHAVAAGAQLDAKPTVAIMYFNNNALVSHADYEALRVGLADILITEMQGNSRIVVVERDQLNKLLAEQNLVTDKRVDAATAARLGKVLGAQHMIFGGFLVDPKGTVRIDARAVNVETSQIEYAEAVTGKAENILDVVSALANKVNAGLRLPAMDRKARPAGDAPAAGRYQAIMLYSRALVEDDKKNTKLAAQYYHEFLDKTPVTFAMDQRRKSETRLKALGG